MSAERRELNLELAQTIGRIEGKLDEALQADRQRISKLEGAQTRQWWMSYVISPFLFLAYATARKLGVHV